MIARIWPYDAAKSAVPRSACGGDRVVSWHKAMNHGGLLIAIEGIDGAGTTSAMAPMAAHLQASGRAVHCTAEPSRGPLGLLLREALKGHPHLTESSLALLFAADRLEHVATEVKMHLDAGAVVLCDRYVLSSYAYQGSACDLAWVQAINAHAPRPDATLFFRVKPPTAAKRRHLRGGHTERFEVNDRQEQVARVYEQALELRDLGPVHIIDAEASKADGANAACLALDQVLRVARGQLGVAHHG